MAGSDDEKTVFDGFRLDGKVALVTGGGSGIGLAMVEAYAEAGASIAVLDLTEEKAVPGVEAAEARGAKALSLGVDVSDVDKLDAAFQRTVKELGGLDVAVANAGIGGAGFDITEYGTEDWQKMIDINLTSVFHTDRAAARIMVERGGGVIINTASIYGIVGDFGMDAVAYTAAKGGVAQITRTIGIQLAERNVRVNAIAPAFFRTNLAEGVLTEDAAQQDPELKALHDEIVRRTPLGRLAESHEVKGLALFLASDASSYCTATVYPIDGGWLAL
jgi:NAD(P)-dependent dehydrogenase (short-subunit alcohol dehydrogenase family)